jgi:dTMP kinase
MLTVVLNWGDANSILYDFFASIVPASDYMFFLDVPPEEASKRIRENRDLRALEMFENIENLRRIRAKALSLVSTDKWKIINGGHTTEEVEKDIAEKLALRNANATQNF